MNAHRDVAVPPESRFIVELYRGRDAVDVEAFLGELAAHRQFRAWGLPVEDVAALLEGSRVPYPAAIEATYEAYARSRRKSRWGDKTPRYIEHLTLLNELFPRSRFVHVVRDGRNVALSYADVPFGPKTIARAAELWARRVRRGIAARRWLGDRYLEVRYEDLVAGREGLETRARALCSFLALPYDPGMVDYEQVAPDEALPKAATLNPLLMRGPVGEARSWQAHMRARQVEVFEAVAGDALSALGYERRFPSPGRRARLAAALALRGAPLGRMRRTPRAGAA